MDARQLTMLYLFLSRKERELAELKRKGQHHLLEDPNDQKKVEALEKEKSEADKKIEAIQKEEKVVTIYT